jgi:purine-binding chemotaxis protein CheW
MSGEAAGRFLAFDLGERCFAVDISRVEVVLESAPITRVPKAPAHLRGVLNYRGAVIPVADLRARFGEGLTAQGSSIIVLQVLYGPDMVTVGVLADTVREVIDLDPERIEAPPRLGSKIQNAMVSGIAERGGEFIVILNIDEAFKAEAAPAAGPSAEAAERETDMR